MASTLTLKNIPETVYFRLKESALRNRRSLNSEAIVCLESALAAQADPTPDHIARARALRATLPAIEFRAEDIDAAKRADRK
ncbi:hypothetical protein Q4S45_14105 [Massilia sp. R2A-15]|uniref:FitA-like ribbon-helix-helix domain-containing protein n=1 Tax=Massilia sp. R2A-15 TaxID=3064278 RepID=UPI0027367B94|nr:hypothetical protein [Massilia sp. R2A-15]WLI87871.1 hypothetical protein Q4S45_14105 [Massilia sp. R2A-15]